MVRDILGSLFTGKTTFVTSCLLSHTLGPFKKFSSKKKQFDSQGVKYFFLAQTSIGKRGKTHLIKLPSMYIKGIDMPFPCLYTYRKINYSPAGTWRKFFLLRGTDTLVDIQPLLQKQLLQRLWFPVHVTLPENRSSSKTKKFATQ